MQMCLLTYGRVGLQADMLTWPRHDCLPIDTLVGLRTDALGGV